jgi:hypothetical protein
MFTFSYIISILFADKPQAEQQRLAGLVAAKGEEYVLTTWKKVKVEDLASEQVKLNLLKVLHASQLGNRGVETEILRALEDWTEGTILFKNLSEADNRFYQTYYCFLGFINFAWVKLTTQTFLLGTRFLLLGFVHDMPLYTLVQGYFARYHWSISSTEDAQLFSGAMSRNRTLFGEEHKLHKPIAEWIQLFDGFMGATLEDRIAEYLENSIDVKRLSEENKALLEKILTLYWGLKGGFIWREVDYVNDGGFEPSTKRENKSLVQYYVQLLSEADHEGITQWLADYQTVAEWIVATGQSDGFVTELFKTLAKKVDLQDGEQIDLVLKLAHTLKEQGLDNVDEVLFYNEKDGQFHWDKELLA